MAFADLIKSDDEFVPTKALVMVAHPDDIDFGAAGTVAAMTDNGIEVVYGLATSGQAGEPSHLSPEELRDVRQKEQTDAAAIVGVSELHWLEFPDGHLVADLALRKAMSRLIRMVKPDLVITQTPVRNLDRIYAAHPDHLAAGEAAISAVYPDARNGHSFPELLDEGHEPHPVPRVWLMAGNDNNLHVDITDSVERKIEALLAHQSQNNQRAEVLPSMITEWAQGNANAAGLAGRSVESFRLVHTE